MARESGKDAVVIDVRGLRCPLPALKGSRRMRAHPRGTRFLLLATDPLSAIDIPNLCREEGHRLLASGREGEVLRFEIEKG